MYSLTYLTRLCPRKCEYCALKNSEGLGKELSANEWIRAFQILKEIGVEFNLILGNEPWLLGKNLIKIMNENKVFYALYTSCFPNLFNSYFESFFNGPIDNLSCGIDYPINYLLRNKVQNDMEKKSWDGWSSFIFTRREFPHVDCQGTITISRKNMHEVPQIVKDLSSLGIFVGLNYIHWNKDGNYDFFPSKEEIANFLFRKEDINTLSEILDTTRKIEGHLVQNVEFFDFDIEQMTSMSWHCKGDPYGGPTIDADGSLRVCGYRRGEYTPKYKIWDLPSEFSKWKNAVELDALNCPGCGWSHPRMYAHYKNDPFIKKVLIQHAGKHIDESKWSKRRLNDHEKID